MIEIQGQDTIEVEKLINAINKGVEIGLQNFGNLVNKDIIIQSKVKKSGITRRVKVNGRVISHTSANANAGESSAELTGNQNKNRYATTSKDELLIGVKDSVVYASKNEERFQDIQQAINKNKDNLNSVIVSEIENIFNNFNI